MFFELSILTLNVWGIPYVSKDREIRINAIGERLSEGDFDVVSLQEVWSENDYLKIKARTKDVLPYSHYFYSGVLGSGLCIFCKYPISSTFYHAWSLNGYMHRIQHGDWFGGKGIGLCRIMVEGYPVNIYVAHLHAEYNRENDEYLTHRLIQAYETAQFVDLTRGDAVLQVLAGDLNIEFDDLAYRLLTSYAKLEDTLTTNDLIYTNDCTYNTYTLAEQSPKGKRIDFILYRSGLGYLTEVIEYKLPLPSRIPTHEVSYSDHEAVYSLLKTTIRDSKINQDNLKIIEGRLNLSNCLKEAVKCFDNSILLLKSQKRSYLFLTVIVWIIYLYLIDLHPSYGLSILFLCSKVALCIFALYLLFMGTVWNLFERNCILASKLSMEVIIQNTEAIDLY